MLNIYSIYSRYIFGLFYRLHKQNGAKMFCWGLFGAETQTISVQCACLRRKEKNKHTHRHTSSTQAKPNNGNNSEKKQHLKVVATLRRVCLFFSFASSSSSLLLALPQRALFCAICIGICSACSNKNKRNSQH